MKPATFQSPGPSRSGAGSPQPLLGAHLSIAGGLHRVIERARALRCTAVQFFTHSTMQWRMPALVPEQTARFEQALGAPRRRRLVTVVHAGYLPNLASPEPALRERSIASMIAELERCEALGVADLVFHPGAHMGAGEAWGLRRITGALRRILRATRGFHVRAVLENTAGQGTVLGADLAHLGRILRGLPDPSRVGICLDTAHAWAAGYDLARRAGYEAFLGSVDREVQIARVRVLHLNDSLRPRGSRVDRHAHIGEGHIGSRAFGWVMREPCFAALPKVIETPKAGDMDAVNLRRLRRLAHPGRA